MPDDMSPLLQLMNFGIGGVVIFFVLSMRKMDIAERKQQNHAWQKLIDETSTRQVSICDEHLRVLRDLSEGIRELRCESKESTSRLTAMLLVNLREMSHDDAKNLLKEIRA